MKNEPESTTRNEQVTGSIPAVGSMKDKELQRFSLLRINLHHMPVICQEKFGPLFEGVFFDLSVGK